MTCTRFWLIRHALVSEAERKFLYGTNDVSVCAETMLSARPTFAALARRVPAAADWYVTPLSRTRRTAAAIAEAGYDLPECGVEPDLIEQHMGEWQGLTHDELLRQLRQPAHAFWPIGGEERPPGGESLADVIVRVGHALERLVARHRDRDVIIVSHGGAIRAAVAHAMGAQADQVLHLAIENLSLTCLQHHPQGWRVTCVNELLGV